MFTYSVASRPVQVAEPFGLGLTFAYDAVGNRTSVVDSKGGITTSTFDASNQLTRRDFTGSTVAFRFDYAYSGRGQLYSETRFKDLAGTQRIGDTIYLHDADGRVYDLKHRGSDGTTILIHDQHTFDAAGRLQNRNRDGVITTYTYDVTNQLTREGTGVTLTYDAMGNRTNSGYTTTTGNRLSNDGLWTYTYDAVGNVTKKSKGTSAETWTYSYDHNNQMTNATQSATDGGSVLGSVTYTYDVFGNRLSRTLDGTTERYGYDGWEPAKPSPLGTENFDVWVDLDGSNAVKMRRGFSTGFDHLSSRSHGDGSSAGIYLTDLQGSIISALDSEGDILGNRSYDAFGNITAEDGKIQHDRYGYTGREWDAFAQLQYNRARMYDPAVGRWYSADPMSFDAGDANLYRYVGNFVTGATDPSGLIGISDILGKGVGSETVIRGWGYIKGVGIGLLGTLGSGIGSMAGAGNYGGGAQQGVDTVADVPQYKDLGYDTSWAWKIAFGRRIPLLQGGTEASLGQSIVPHEFGRALTDEEVGTRTGAVIGEVITIVVGGRVIQIPLRRPPMGPSNTPLVDGSGSGSTPPPLPPRAVPPELPRVRPAPIVHGEVRNFPRPPNHSTPKTPRELIPKNVKEPVEPNPKGNNPPVPEPKLEPVPDLEPVKIGDPHAPPPKPNANNPGGTGGNGSGAGDGAGSGGGKLNAGSGADGAPSATQAALDAAQNAWGKLPPNVRSMMWHINNGLRPLSDFTKLPAAQREVILEYYRATAANAHKANAEAVRQLNQHRIDYLLGRRPDPPGGISNFPIPSGPE